VTTQAAARPGTAPVGAGRSGSALTSVVLGGRRVRLEDRDLLGVGGEGRVFRAGNRAIKVFFTLTPERERKLRAFPVALPPAVVGPLELCTDLRGDVVGYAMQPLDGAVDAHRLTHRKWRAGTMDANEVLEVFRELEDLVTRLHLRGVTVGDLNDGNVVVTRGATGRRGAGWAPWLIDADSMQWSGFPCVVAHERFLDPRLFGVDLARTAALSPASDWYAFAVMLFGSVFHVHPFGGAHPSYPTMLRRAEARHSVLRGDVKLPHAAVPLQAMPDDALGWWLDVFERDRREPPPPALLQASFSRCSCGLEHARRACPACTVHVAAPGGAPGGSAPPAPAPIVTLGRLRATRFYDPRSDPRSVEAVLEGLTSASRNAARVRLEGDWLVRPADGMRIGQVLEGQTHVATAATMGLCFYRAGAITMFFVFDPRRGPLRQLSLPHLEGRLVDWSVAFDDAHALFEAITEKDGRATHVAHLVDARGEVLASHVAPTSAAPFPDGLSGRGLAGGSILSATADGLVLLRADRATRRFVTARAFPETRDLVPPDADLLVGPGGSIYVVTHDAIVHLVFEGSSSP